MTCVDGSLEQSPPLCWTMSADMKCEWSFLTTTLLPLCASGKIPEKMNLAGFLIEIISSQSCPKST